MNELIFFVQIFFIICFTLACLRWGKEALIANAAFQALFANLFLLKQINLFGFEVTASDAFAVGSMLSINLLREFYSKESAMQSVRISFFFLLFFALLSQTHLLYIPSTGDVAHKAYTQLFSLAPRLFFSSLFTFWVVQQFDLRFFGWLTRILPGQSFSVRSTFSLIVSQGLDTLLFTFLGLYGLVASTVDVLFVSFFIKWLAISTLLPLSTFIKRQASLIGQSDASSL